MALPREITGYLLASALALGLDMALFLSLAQIMHYLIAASIGFAGGAVIAYLLSVRWVFRRRRMKDTPRGELAVFVTVGVAGLGVNALVIHFMVAGVVTSLLLAKLVAAGTTFSFNFALRKCLLF